VSITCLFKAISDLSHHLSPSHARRAFAHEQKQIANITNIDVFCHISYFSTSQNYKIIYNVTPSTCENLRTDYKSGQTIVAALPAQPASKFPAGKKSFPSSQSSITPDWLYPYFP
jgi:hypothetical protein